MSAALAGAALAREGDIPIASVVVALGVFLMGVGAWTQNELSDRLRDRHGVGPKYYWGLYLSGGTGLLSDAPKSGLRTVQLIAAAELVSGLVLVAVGGFVVFLLGLTLLSMGLAYSVAPVRLKARGIPGGVLTAIAAGAIPFIMGLAGNSSATPPVAIVGGVAILLLALVTTCLGHALDVAYDSSVGDRTIAVRMGRERALRLGRRSSWCAIALLFVLLVSCQRLSSPLSLTLMLLCLGLAVAVHRWTLPACDASLGPARLMVVLQGCSAGALLMSI